MKSLQLYRRMVWVLAMAYLALLAHAFVPHHHHQDGNTAFVNHKTCPEDIGDPHSHPSYTSDCETLKHTLLREGDTGGFQPTSVFLPDLSSLFLPERSDLPEISLDTKTWIVWKTEDPKQGLSNASGLRGPPYIS